MTVETLIGTVIGFLANSISKSTGGKKVTNEFSEATWNWIRPIFIKDDEKEILDEFEKSPTSKETRQKVQLKVEEYVKANSEKKEELLQLYNLIKQDSTQQTTNNILQFGDKPVVVTKNDGTININ